MRLEIYVADLRESVHSMAHSLSLAFVDSAELDLCYACGMPIRGAPGKIRT